MQQMEPMICFVSVPFGTNKIIVENYFLMIIVKYLERNENFFEKKCAQTLTDV